MATARRYLYIQTLKTIYNTMVYPYLTYCCIIYVDRHLPNKAKIHIYHTEKDSENNDLCKVSR